VKLSTFFPGWAVRRERARRELEVLETRRFQTQSTFRRGAFDASSADSALAPAAFDLRQQSRHLAENHDLYVSILNELCDQIVGTGLHIEPMGVSNRGRALKRWNEDMARVWSDWIEHPEATGELSWTEAQRRVCWGWIQDGERFIRHLTSGYPFAQGQLRYVFSVLEPDYCPVDESVNAGTRFDNQVVQGIKHDEWGRPEVYFFYKEHPGDNLRPLSSRLDLIEVPAAEVTHLKFTRRWPQVRGQPLAHACFRRLSKIDMYEDYELDAANVGATLAAAITKDIDLAPAGADAIGGGDQRTLQLTSGSIYELLPGESVSTISADRPNPEVSNFRAVMLRAAAGGAGTKYSTVARDFNSSYSAARQEMVEGDAHYLALRDGFVSGFLRPVYQRVVRAAMQAGRVELPATTTFERATRLEVAGPGVAWIDPLKEAQADVLLINERLASRKQILRKRGTDPLQLAIQLEAEAAEDPDDDATRPSEGPTDADEGGDAPVDQSGSEDGERSYLN